MTDRIDLDEMDAESDDEPAANKGDWLWRGEGNLDAEPDGLWFDSADDASPEEDADTSRTPDSENEPPDDRDAADPGAGDGDDERAEGGDPDRDPLPGVPRLNSDRPVGVPIESGGAGGTAAANREDGADSTVDHREASGSGREERSTAGHRTSPPAGADGGESPAAADGETQSAASGPHGGGVDDMTMALTYDAVRSLTDPRFAVIDAKAWTDWIGIVADAPAYRINAFQREHEIDADFFSGAGQGPAERLADIDEHSMFYAERMVLVGVDGQESIAERAGWEFVHLETAAEKADWELSDGN